MFFESIEKSAFKVVQAGLRCGRQTKKLQKTNNSNFGDEDSTLKKRFPFHFVRVCLPLRKLQSFKVLVFLWVCMLPYQKNHWKGEEAQHLGRWPLFSFFLPLSMDVSLAVTNSFQFLSVRKRAWFCWAICCFPVGEKINRSSLTRLVAPIFRVASWSIRTKEWYDKFLEDSIC